MSLLFFVLKEKSIRTLDLVFNCGYNGLQLTPIRGITEIEISHLPKRNIIGYEADWLDEKKFFDFANFLVFGSQKRVLERIEWFASYFPDAYPIDVKHDPDSLRELSPVNGRTESDFLNHSPGVVFDTWYFLDFDLLDPYSLVEKLLEQGKIKLVHCQTRNYDDLDLFLSGAPSDLGRLLSLGMQSKTSVVVELPPQWLAKKPKEKLIQLKNRISDLYAKIE